METATRRHDMKTCRSPIILTFAWIWTLGCEQLALMPDEPVSDTTVAIDAPDPRSSIDVMADADDDGSGPGCIDPSTTRRFVRGPSGAEKVCQLTGEEDRERGEPTVNRTLTRANVYGTDLGASFEHDGKLWFLFGDTWSATSADDDAIAWSEDADPDDCVEMEFPVDERGNWIPPEVPGVSQGAFEVPLDGVSVGDAMYVYFSTDHSPDMTMGRSILARSLDNGRTFEHVADISVQGRFINISAVAIDNADWPGLPSSTGRGLLLWGSGVYRASNVALAWQPLDEIEDPSAIRYFAGLGDDGCSPTWSEHETDAEDLFDEPCVGELSVEWNPHIETWLMTYNCHEPRGIRYRTSDVPWGSWSESRNLFHPWTDGGYCHFMHVSHDFRECDEVHDSWRQNEWGGGYGPYQIARYSKAIPGGAAIYFVMSTWNPYNVVLMRAELIEERNLAIPLSEVANQAATPVNAIPGPSSLP
jgi:hypothetical protein